MTGATLAAFFTSTGGGAGAGIYDTSSPGTGSVTIPSGATGVTIEIWGAGGGGGKGGTYLIAPGEPEEYDGGGGGGGGYSKTVLVLGGGDALKTINYTVGTAGAGATVGAPGTAGTFSNVYSGSYTITTMTANGGQQGTSTPLYTQGAGGTASGGNTTNTTGNGGASFTNAGAAGIAGDNSLTAGAGGNGGFSVGENGQNGRVRMVFT